MLKKLKKTTVPAKFCTSFIQAKWSKSKWSVKRELECKNKRENIRRVVRRNLLWKYILIHFKQATINKNFPLFLQKLSSYRNPSMVLSLNYIKHSWFLRDLDSIERLFYHAKRI